MVVVLSGEAVASHASFVYQPKPADPEEVELAASAKSFLWRKHKPWACMPVRQSKLFTLDEQTANRAHIFFYCASKLPILTERTRKISLDISEVFL